MTAIAHRKAMHGPLWIVEQNRTRVQLWAPSHRREQWALGWTTTDADGEVIDSDHLRAPDLGAFAAMVPNHLRKLVGAVLSAGSAWDPTEECDHTRATSFGVLDDERQECGYCGRAFTGRA